MDSIDKAISEEVVSAGEIGLFVRCPLQACYEINGFPAQEKRHHRRGRGVHEKVEERIVKSPEDFLISIRHELSRLSIPFDHVEKGTVVESDYFMIIGKPDFVMVLENGDSPIRVPIEMKNSRPSSSGIYPHDMLQEAAYSMVMDPDLGMGIVYYKRAKPGRRMQKFDVDEGIRTEVKRVRDAVARMRVFKGQYPEMLPEMDDIGYEGLPCMVCRYNHFCDNRCNVYQVICSDSSEHPLRHYMVQTPNRLRM